MYGSFTSEGMQIFTPPMALIISFKPLKSTTMKFWMFRPVSELTAFTVQLAAEARSSPVV